MRITGLTSFPTFTVGAYRSIPITRLGVCPSIYPVFAISYNSSTNSTKVAFFRSGKLGYALTDSNVQDGFYMSVDALGVVFDYFAPVQLTTSGVTRVSFSTDRPVILSLPPQTRFPVNITISAVSGIIAGVQKYSYSDCSGESGLQNFPDPSPAFFSLLCPNSTVILAQNQEGVDVYQSSIVEVSVQQSQTSELQFSYSTPATNSFSVNVSSSFGSKISITLPTAQNAVVSLSSPQQTVAYSIRPTCCAAASSAFSVGPSDARNVSFPSSSSTAILDLKQSSVPNATVFVQVRYGADFCSPGATIGQCDGIVDFPITQNIHASAPAETLRELDSQYPSLPSSCRATLRRQVCLQVANPCTPGYMKPICQTQCLVDVQAACPDLPLFFHLAACASAGQICPPLPIPSPRATGVPFAGSSPAMAAPGRSAAPSAAPNTSQAPAAGATPLATSATPAQSSPIIVFAALFVAIAVSCISVAC